MNGQNPDERYWEFGEFRMSVRDKHNKHYFDRLVTTSRPLYASKFVPGSSLTVKPGEWITARISFRIEVQNNKFEAVNVGKAALAMEWFQTGRSRAVRNCGVTLGYFPCNEPFKIRQSESSRDNTGRTCKRGRGTYSIVARLSTPVADSDARRRPLQEFCRSGLGGNSIDTQRNLPHHSN
jgi:hypothetical protein